MGASDSGPTGAHNQNSALALQNSEKWPSKQRKGYIATCKDVLIETAQINYL